MGRPPKHDERTREAVLDAAEELLAEGGPAAVTVRAIAARLDESTRAVYSQFPSRDALMGSLGARGFQMVADLVNALPTTDDPIADLVAAGADAFRAYATTRPQLFRITFHEVSRSITEREDARRALRASYDALAARFSRAIDQGALPDRPVIDYAFAFHSFTSGLAANELSMRPPPVGANFWQVAHDLDMPAVWRESIGAYLRGLTTTRMKPR